MLDAADYITAGVGGAKFNATVRAASTWPSTYSHPEAVSVAYTVGFGDSPADVPDLIRHAVLLVFGAFYEFRENVTAEPVAELPVASKALLRDWRPLAVA